jgi:S1-C subfamily serine protease
MDGSSPARSGNGQQSENQKAKITRGLGANSGGGFTVIAAPPGSVAAEVGLKPGDVVLMVNGSPVDSAAEFARIYEQEGRPRQLELVRDGLVLHSHP